MASIMNQIESIHISTKDLTVDDLPDVVRVHAAAFPDTVLSEFGDAVLTSYYRWHLAHPLLVVARGAWIGPELVGYSVVMRDHSFADFVRAHKWLFIWSDLKRVIRLRPSLLYKRFIRNRGQIVDAYLLWYFKTSQMFGNRVKRKSSERICWLHVLATDPSRFGCGVGSALLKFSEERVASLGFSRLMLGVQADNSRALSLYEHRGWKRCGSRESTLILCKPINSDRADEREL